jgi:pyruvate,water dikinase
MMPVALREAADETAFGGKAVQLAAAIRAGLPALGGPLAVRSSAVGEDSAGASFAGGESLHLLQRRAITRGAG